MVIASEFTGNPFNAIALILFYSLWIYSTGFYIFYNSFLISSLTYIFGRECITSLPIL
jgi:hypothetical protein